MKNYHTTRSKRLPLLQCAVLAVAFLYGVGAKAQTTDPREAFETFRRQAQQSYASFREQCLNDYADFVRRAWDAYEGKAPIPKPKDDKVPPVVKPKVEPPKPKPQPLPIVIEEVVEPQPVPPQPEPIEPIKEVPQPREEYADFVFFGTKAQVRYEKSSNIMLRSADANVVADALLKLGDGRCENTLYDCLELRRNHSLCDWAYLMMLKELAYSIYGNDTNEAVLMMAYLYMQSGYMMRLAESGGHLYMMFASDHVLYDHTSYKIDGYRYFGVEDLPNRLNICKASFPKESSMSLLVNSQQGFDNNLSEMRERKSVRYPDVKAQVAVNKNWLDFCSTYPTSMIEDNFVTRWAMYANAPMSENVKEQLYPQLRKAIEGADQLTAVNRILNWVQTGFQYEYDDKVWGCDRAFFPEESLYYPYCDCEDRSILLTRIIRDMLGLKCILIYYPGHLAAAVEITEGNPTGDYIDFMGRRFFITDGTIIGWGAPVGTTMDGMDNALAKVILLE